ncbi:MAG: DUF4855 domain-containing protein [Thermoproteota archaeon]|nr:DUF4855 domain-containing protein [Candidatus Brockarchaeota archaeon]
MKLKVSLQFVVFLLVFLIYFPSFSSPADQSIQRIVLVYIDKYNNMTLSDYKVLLAYNESNINDTFFNTFLFLGQFSNSGESYEGYEKGSSYNSWLWWLSKIFGNGGQIKQLNAAAEDVSRYVKLSEVNVIIMIPRPLTNLTLEERYINVRNYVCEVVQTFKERNYNKLKLVGFYWTCETAPEEDYELIKKVSALIHSFGLKLYWIPYFGAEGINRWKELGFDYVMLQPNFAFSNVDVERFSIVEKIMNNLSVSVEMELPTFVYNPKVNWQESFVLYMYYSSIYNWQKLPVISYFNGNQFSQLLYKKYKPYYDLIYIHVKGKDLRSNDLVLGGYNYYKLRNNLKIFASLFVILLIVALVLLFVGSKKLFHRY